VRICAKGETGCQASRITIVPSFVVGKTGGKKFRVGGKGCKTGGKSPRIQGAKGRRGLSRHFTGGLNPKQGRWGSGHRINWGKGREFRRGRHIGGKRGGIPTLQRKESGEAIIARAKGEQVTKKKNINEKKKGGTAKKCRSPQPKYVTECCSQVPPLEKAAEKEKNRKVVLRNRTGNIRGQPKKVTSQGG